MGFVVSVRDLIFWSNSWDLVLRNLFGMNLWVACLSSAEFRSQASQGRNWLVSLLTLSWSCGVTRPGYPKCSNTILAFVWGIAARAKEYTSVVANWNTQTMLVPARAVCFQATVRKGFDTFDMNWAGKVMGLHACSGSHRAEFDWLPTGSACSNYVGGGRWAALSFLF